MPATQEASVSSFSVGPYKLAASIEDLRGLAEFSASEYEIMGKQFAGEKNYNAPAAPFLGATWKIKLQTVNGKICKIAPYLVLMDGKAASLCEGKLAQFCIDRFGQPSEQHPGLSIWDAPDGNIVLRTGRVGEEWCVGLFVTARPSEDLEIVPEARAPKVQAATKQSLSKTSAPLRRQIILVTNLVTASVVLGLWIFDSLSWSIGAQVFVLWLLAPFGMMWSCPTGERVHLWRAASSLIAIVSLSELIAYFVR